MGVGPCFLPESGGSHQTCFSYLRMSVQGLTKQEERQRQRTRRKLLLLGLGQYPGKGHEEIFLARWNIIKSKGGQEVKLREQPYHPDALGHLGGVLTSYL